MAVPNVGLRTIGSSIPNPGLQSSFINFYVEWQLTWAVGSGAFGQELSGSTAIVSDMSQGFTNVQNDIVNQMLTFLNARYGVVFGGGQVVWLP